MLPCSCCGLLTIGIRSYEICPVCLWQHPDQNDDPVYEGGVNRTSLEKARLNDVRFGSSTGGAASLVRSAVLEETPPPIALLGLDDEFREMKERSAKVVLLGVVRAVEHGSIGPLDGCVAITEHAQPSGVFDRFNAVLQELRTVRDEICESPRGPVRKLWSTEALVLSDARFRAYEDRVRAQIVRACARLADLLAGDLRP